MKGYWIAHVDVIDPEQYSQYASRAPEAFARYGGRILARGGRCEAMENGPAAPRNVVIEFESYDQAVACYNSPEYQAAAQYREGAGVNRIVIVEGV